MRVLAYIYTRLILDIARRRVFFRSVWRKVQMSVECSRAVTEPRANLETK